MASKSSKPDAVQAEPKRLNRAVGIAEAVGKLLDPSLRKRGFASRDIIDQWAAIAPTPYDKVAMPDKLSWPRGERSVEGATLYLRCEPGFGLAVSHDGASIARAVNRYFGYVLVGQVRLSATPFSTRSGETADKTVALSEKERSALDTQLADVTDPEIRAALHKLGEGLKKKAKIDGQCR